MKTTVLLAVALGLTTLSGVAAHADETAPAVYAIEPMTAEAMPEVAPQAVVADVEAEVEPVAVDVPMEEATVASADSVDSETVGKLKMQNIRVEDRFGTIEEDRVQAMRSELRYVPTGSADGYNLIESNGSQGKSQSAHQGSDMKISSWKLFTW